MTALAQLLDQRSHGHVRLRMEERGIATLQEAGCSKVRVPRGAHEAILINVSGGLAGGDTIAISATAGARANLTLTTQAAERVYRTLGPAADVSVALKADEASTLLWLPQETIFFEGSALRRTFEVDLADGATFLAIEPMIFGRGEMGETVRNINITDNWHIRQNGKLLHAEAFRLGPQWPISQARLAENRATAGLVMVSPHAEQLLDHLRSVIGPQDGASAWNGKLVARFLASDGYALRKTLIQAICACVGNENVPKCWTF
jgi:urease accessory protein